MTGGFYAGVIERLGCQVSPKRHYAFSDKQISGKMKEKLKKYYPNMIELKTDNLYKIDTEKYSFIDLGKYAIKLSYLVYICKKLKFKKAIVSYSDESFPIMITSPFTNGVGFIGPFLFDKEDKVREKFIKLKDMEYKKTQSFTAPSASLKDLFG